VIVRSVCLSVIDQESSSRFLDRPVVAVNFQFSCECKQNRMAVKLVFIVEFFREEPKLVARGENAYHSSRTDYRAVLSSSSSSSSTAAAATTTTSGCNTEQNIQPF